MNSAFAPQSCSRLVLKVGSSLLLSEEGEVRREWAASLVEDIAQRRAQGQQIIVVSSGAIALGARKLDMGSSARDSLATAQAAASVGQIALSAVWDALFTKAAMVAAQMLVTLDDLEDRRRYLNATATLNALLAANAVPVINENDSVATEEIRFGDNDRLAARIGQACGAHAVVLLSDVDGLFDKNPTAHADAKLVPHVEKISPEILNMADSLSGSGMGSGGMASKLQAAQIAQIAGMHLAIVSGRHPYPLRRWSETGRGTVFQPLRKDKARKVWLGGRIRKHGTIAIDAGAAQALQSGSSLLAAGATHVTGNFQRGDLIEITGPGGTLLARGLAEYDAIECAKILGRQSSELVAILGYAPRSALVHRDHMVML